MPAPLIFPFDLPSKMKRKPKKYTGIHQVTYVPLRISASFALPARAWKLAPGLWLQRLTGKVKDDLAAEESRVKPSSGINPNYTVKIDSIAYGDHVIAKLIKAGKTIPNYPQDMDPIGFDCVPITKMILISLLLQNDLRFAFAYAHGFRVLPSGTYDKHFTWQNAHRREEMSWAWWYSLPRRPTDSIDRAGLRRTLSSIEPYFRPLTWETNRISTALTYFWNSLVSDDPNQLFTNSAILLECLLGTDHQELKHKICERAAMIIGKNRDGRLSIYKELKAIYDQRSKIVHGEGAPKKGRLHADQFMVSTKHAQCPKTLMSKIIRVSIDLLNALLRDEQYVSIVRSTKSEGKTNQLLNEFFMRRLFQG